MNDDVEARLPVHLWIDAQLAILNGRGIFYYVTQKGERNSGLILLKLNGLCGFCSVLIQQRDLEGNLCWMHAFDKEQVEECDADQYIQRSINRDPDLWVIEIEDRDMQNPFEGSMISGDYF